MVGKGSDNNIFIKVLEGENQTPIFAVPKTGAQLLTFKAGNGDQGLVVQLVRMPPCHGGGRGFESRPVRSIRTKIAQN